MKPIKRPGLSASLILFTLFLTFPVLAQETTTVSPISDPVYLNEIIARAEKTKGAFSISGQRQYGTVTIKSGEFNGASVYFHGKKTTSSLPLYVTRQNTPVQNLKLFAGTHTVTLSHSKSMPVTESFQVKPETHSDVVIPLSPKKSRVKVVTSPTGAKVSIMGKLMGTTTDSGLVLPIYDKGQHIIQIEKSGYQTTRRNLRVYEGENQGLNVILVPQFAAVKISTPKEGSFAYVNNIYRGRTPIKVANLRPGRITIRTEQEKHAPAISSIIVNAGDTASVMMTPTVDKSIRDVSPYGQLKGSWGDKDGDGIPDKLDGCSEDPEDIDGFEDSDGCPDNDNDGDGVPDIKDKCPNEAEDFDGFEDIDGCPEPDNDADGVSDSVDLCINDPEDRDGFEDIDGCPDVDNDGDGIPDATDKCPNEPEDFDGFEDTDGCPEPDNDADGIWDYMDICPDSAEVFNSFMDDDGCPDIRVIEPPKGIFARMQYVFDQKLDDSIFVRIDSVYDAMIAYPEIQIEIKVHSDNRGNAPRKLEYTKQLAKLLAVYLDTRKTVASSRYSVTGVGGSDPLASNVSEDGRRKNTRIEIRRIK